MTRSKRLLVQLLICAQVVWLGACAPDSIGGGGASSGNNISAIIAQLNVGNEVFKLYRANLEAETNPQIRGARLAALDARRADFIGAINSVVNGKTLPGVEITIDAIFKLIDDGSLPALTDELATVLQELRDEPNRPTVKALVQVLDGRAQVPTTDLVELLGRLVNYKESQELWTAIGSLVEANDGVDAQGKANGERRLLQALLALLSRRLQTLGASTQGAPQSSFKLAWKDFVKELLSDAKLAAPVRFGAPEWAVRLDDRGAPLVQPGLRGGVPAPFADNDNDGLPDLSSSGQFVDAQGRELDLPPFGKAGTTGFDLQGRAVDPSGRLRYVNFDAKRSILALFLSIGGRLVRQNRHVEFVRVLDAALGTRANGHYDPLGPATQLAHGALELVKYQGSPKLLRALSSLLNQRPDQAEQLLISLGRAFDRLRVAKAGAFSQLALSDPQTRALIDNLMPIADQVFESGGNAPSTARFLISTLGDLRRDAPRWPAKLAPLFEFQTVVRESSPDADANDIDESRSLAVDRSSPATGFNRSTIHQLLDLIARADKCSIFGNNLAVLTINLMAGLKPSTVGTLVSLLNVAPGVANLFCAGISQDLVSLDALAKSGGLDALLPIAKVFKDRGQTPLLVELLVQVQKGYSASLLPIEEDVAALLDSGVFEELSEILALAAASRDPVSGENIADILAESLADLVDDDRTVLDAAGRKVPSLAYLLINPLSEMDATLGAAGRQQDFVLLVDALAQAVLARALVNGQERLQSQATVPFLAKLFDIAAKRLPRDPATRAKEATELQNQLPGALGDKDLAVFVDVATVMATSPQSPQVMASIANMLTPHPNRADDIFGAVLKVSVPLLQQEFDLATTAPLLAFLGRALDPARPLVPLLVRVVERLLALDRSGSVLNLLRAALNPTPQGGTAPALVILEITEEVQRAASSGGGGLSEADVVELIDGFIFALSDAQSGLPRFYLAIRRRRR